MFTFGYKTNIPTTIKQTPSWFATGTIKPPPPVDDYDQKLPVETIGIGDLAKDFSQTDAYKKNVGWKEGAFLKAPNWIISDDTKIAKLPGGQDNPEYYKNALKTINAANLVHKDYGSSQQAKDMYKEQHYLGMGGNKSKKKNKKTKRAIKKNKKSKSKRVIKNKK
jgi:hypothetical protein